MESVAAEKVECNDDILMSILVRLPPKSVFRFRCVSNRWNSIIVGSYFLRSYSTTTKYHLRGACLLASLQLTLPDIYVRIFLACLVDKNIELVPSKLGKFIISSNGLILCGEHSSNTYHVWNPITKKSFSLPQPEITIESTYEGTFTGFVCEENTNELVPNYTVLRGGQQPICGGPRDTTMDIEIYSSSTGMWAKSTLFSTGFFYIPVEQPPPLVCNGVMHLMLCKSIALYDLNEGGNHLQLIKFPVQGDRKYIDSSFTRSECDDVLWFVVTYFDHGMHIWMLPKNKSGSYMRSTTIHADEWRLMHTIMADSLLKELGIPLMLENNYEYDLYSIWLEGLISCACVTIGVVIRAGERIFLYNLETKSIELLHYDEVDPTKRLYPYMESHYLSSYAL